MFEYLDPARIDPALDCRAVTFENPTGARGAGGTAAGGRKGAPNRVIAAGESVVLADIEGPGTLRHWWMTFLPAPPERMRSLFLDVYYDGATEPSVSVPCLDFFGLPHGRPVAYASALSSAQEARGFNAYFPMPFAEHVRVELINAGPSVAMVYYQIDYTLEPALPADTGYLHVGFRRQNPTVVRDDFVIVDGLHGPGRFLGCNVGIRVIDGGDWYGEGELKVYRDGDDALPTICGTGLEDYVGSAWGMGAHAAPFAGAPLVVGPPGGGPMPEFVSFYRWHLHDPIMFSQDLEVTIQQIGSVFFAQGQEERFAKYAETNPAAGDGWIRNPAPGLIAFGLAERKDDYCATSFVYCTRPQPVPPVQPTAALADIDRREWEQASPFEAMTAVLTPALEAQLARRR